MFDAAAESSGGVVALSTSNDERFPPENIIDGKTETFWTSTGLYPQEFIITFNSLMSVSSVRIQSTNIRKMTIEQSMKVELAEFDTMVEKEFDYNDGQLQREEFKLASPIHAKHLRFVVEQGYDHFVSVHRVIVMAEAVR